MGHGRIEERCLICSDALLGYSDWAGLHQVFKVDRKFTNKGAGKVHEETVYGITSLTPQEAGPERLLSLIRGIENRTHWVRDVTFDEDRSQVRKGNTPEVMSALRNTVIGLMRYAGAYSIILSSLRSTAVKGIKTHWYYGIAKLEYQLVIRLVLAYFFRSISMLREQEKIAFIQRHGKLSIFSCLYANQCGIAIIH